MNTRITDLQDQLLDAQSKFSNSEKARQKLQNQINSLTSDCDTVNKKAHFNFCTLLWI
jgi:peptidoglycan hydrolase CwlO-like protein